MLINLAVADLLIGFTEAVSIRTYGIPPFYSDFAKNTQYGNVSTAFQAMFAANSVGSLALISLERAFALICPFRHRVISTRAYIYSIIFVWFSGITVGAFTLLAVNGIVDFIHWIVVYCCILASCLLTICVTYLIVRAFHSFYAIYRCLPIPLTYASTVLRPANSLVNPVIHWFRMSILREAVGIFKLNKQSKEYKINC